ncbi:TolC family protein [Cytophagales bacterium LB-30]|uniref:TolC family protein n=1 Tax=Shiella aurantiaca TaxID=3058365 RepID=A0ABT8F9Q2_9BACT|nr:TolC family protein [Shiella aurantiaca]MDN4167013.1 TolC family protein [Shiella aurantiaca]
MRYLLIYLFITGSSALLQAQNLNNLLNKALQYNAGLREQQSAYEASTHAAAQVGTLPDPMLSASAFGQMVETRTGPQIARFSLSQQFPWPGTLSGKKQVAELESQAKKYQQEEAQAQLLWEIRNLYFTTQSQMTLLKLQKENLAWLLSMKKLAMARYENGKASLVEILEIDLSISQLETEIQVTERSILPLVKAISNKVNAEPLDSLPTLDLGQLLNEHHAGEPQEVNPLHPKLQEIQQMQSASGQMQQVARKEGLPMIELGFDYWVIGERMDTDHSLAPADNGKDAFMPMVSLSLPIYRNKYKGQSQQAKHMTEAYAHRQTDVQNTLDASFRQALSERQQSRWRIESLQKQLSTIERMQRLTQTAFSQNEVAMSEVLSLHQMEIEYRMQLAMAQTECLKAEAALAYFTYPTN